MDTTDTKTLKYKSFSGKGVDVASQRADDLDRLCLDHIGKKSNSSVLDLGSGQGGQSVRIALAGAGVLAVDSFDFEKYFDAARTEYELHETQLSFRQGDIKVLPSLITQQEFTDVLFQRAVHYLTYQDARTVLTYLHEKVEDALFVSVTGINSAIGTDYADREKAVADRFCTLATESAETFSITEPICLYTKEEFISLLESCGWTVQECWESAFGNIKAVCSH